MDVRKAGEEGSRAARLCTAGRRADTQLGEPTMLPAIYLRHLAKNCPSLAERHIQCLGAASCLLFTDLLAGCANIYYT